MNGTGIEGTSCMQGEISLYDARPLYKKQAPVLPFKKNKKSSCTRILLEWGATVSDSLIILEESMWKPRQTSFKQLLSNYGMSTKPECEGATPSICAICELNMHSLPPQLYPQPFHSDDQCCALGVVNIQFALYTAMHVIPLVPQ